MPRVRPHVNPLRSQFLSRRLSAEALPEGRDVEVELGCAEAQFLFERVALNPAIVPIGLEIRTDLVDDVNARARAAGSPVRAIFCNANVDFAALFPPGSLARVFVNFPDPWFKRRHHKRRVLDAALAADLAVALRPGGELFFQTDIWELAIDALAVFEDETALCNAAGAWSFWKSGNPYGVRSRREQGCQEEGAPIWRILYSKGPVKTPPAAATPAP